ncbi:MAG: peptide deformylase [Sedimentisphaerales bacterium]|nr:peptide deformylase [Sedimentisphaerales bacterium]
MTELDVSRCKLTKYPTPVLMAPTEPIKTIDGKICDLAERMIDIMIRSGGVGLAGPQAGVNLQIFVVSVNGTKENAKVYINPEIEVSGGLEGYEEGCLSLPGVYAKIKRHKKCTVTAMDLDGNQFTETGEGLLARAFQHEYDHLQGRMIKDRMGRVQQIAARRRLRELEEQYENK